MSETIFTLPLDLTGTVPGNRVVNETHTIGTIRGRLFAPDFGPFFGNSVQLVDAVSGAPLVAVQDYVLVHYHREASNAAGQAVYCAVRIVNPAVNTQVRFTGQHVGGEYAYSYYAIKQAIEALAEVDGSIQWGDLIGVPSQFVPNPHLHSAYDLYGLRSLVESNNAIADAITNGDTATRQLHLDMLQDGFDVLDDFCGALADLFDAAATELSQL